MCHFFEESVDNILYSYNSVLWEFKNFYTLSLFSLSVVTSILKNANCQKSLVEQSGYIKWETVSNIVDCNTASENL